MRKIIFATIGLAMFATPLAAENPHSGYPHAERDGSFSSSSYTPAAQQRPLVSPSGLTRSFGLAPARTSAGFGLSTSAASPNQDLRDRYGRIDR